jgi:hypothetical protein
MFCFITRRKIRMIKENFEISTAKIAPFRLG